MTVLPSESNVTSGVHSAATTWTPLLSIVLLGSRRVGSPMPMVTGSGAPLPSDAQPASAPQAMIGTASQAISFTLVLFRERHGGIHQFRGRHGGIRGTYQAYRKYVAGADAGLPEVSGR